MESETESEPSLQVQPCINCEDIPGSGMFGMHSSFHRVDILYNCKLPASFFGHKVSFFMDNLKQHRIWRITYIASHHYVVGLHREQAHTRTGRNTIKKKAKTKTKEL